MVNQNVVGKIMKSVPIFWLVILIAFVIIIGGLASTYYNYSKSLSKKQIMLDNVVK